MEFQKLSVIAFAVAAASSQMALASEQADSQGFIEDSSLSVLSRVLYMNRDFRNGVSNDASISSNPAGYREETGLGVRVLFESGFTQGTVGVGFDAHSLSSVKLDSGKGRYGTDQFGQTDDGSADDTQSEVGGALKLRLSSTTLKYGNQMVESPVLSTDDARILPEIATGTLLTSNEIEGLELSAGRFTAMSSMQQSSRDDFALTSANIVGANYSFSDNFSAGIHASDVEDHFKKQYLNLNYTLPLAEERSLNLDFNAYRSKDDGQALSGALDNRIWSLAAAYTMGAHTFTLAHQRSSGDTGYTYGVDGGGTVWLGNSVQYSDFIGEDERSWQVRYDLDMASFGVPGLTLMGRYITGTDITIRDDDGLIADQDAKEHELNLEAQYVLQEGVAKDLSFRVRHALYRADEAYDDDVNEVRLIVEYPLSLL